VSGVLTGFVALVAVVLVGYVSARRAILPAEGQEFLARVVFYLASPALLFGTLLETEIDRIFSPLLAGVAISSAAMALLYAGIAAALWRRTVGQLVIGALSSSYVNAANVGIPITAYVLGDASYVAPVLLLQLLVMAPAALSVLDVSSSTGAATSRAWLRPLVNPIIVASALGLLLGVTGVPVPAWVLAPVDLLAGAAVPLALLVYGMSLHDASGARAVTRSGDLVLATVLKVAVHPLVAYAVGRGVLGMEGEQLMALTILAALPTAQNIYVYALRYRQSLELARGAIFLSTVLSVGGVLVVVALLG
jgi:malonate transporter and related proteins